MLAIQYQMTKVVEPSNEVYTFTLNSIAVEYLKTLLFNIKLYNSVMEIITLVQTCTFFSGLGSNIV